jgi:hypothetical protein
MLPKRNQRHSQNARIMHMKGTLTPVRPAMPAEQDGRGWPTVAAGVATVAGVIVAMILGTVLLAMLVG